MSEPDNAPPRPTKRAFRSPRAWLILMCVAVVGLSLDLGLKQWSFDNVASAPVVLDRQELLNNQYWRIPRHEPMVLLDGILTLHLVENRGAVFGIGADHRIFFIAFTVAALLAAVFVFARSTTHRSWLAHIGIGMILAGGMGNLYDRVAFGVVRDFLHMFPGGKLPFDWHWPGGSTELFPWVFNTADILLLVGMTLLLLHINKRERLQKQSQAAEQNAQGESVLDEA
ncbi:MAG: signal peptidase II [Planctomycetes bacterium]|nr:signal peptidase II [Planctomycetota bacterium]